MAFHQYKIIESIFPVPAILLPGVTVSAIVGQVPHTVMVLLFLGEEAD
jgi:hypothetical protein